MMNATVVNISGITVDELVIKLTKPRGREAGVKVFSMVKPLGIY